MKSAALQLIVLNKSTKGRVQADLNRTIVKRQRVMTFKGCRLSGLVFRIAILDINLNAHMTENTFRQVEEEFFPVRGSRPVSVYAATCRKTRHSMYSQSDQRRLGKRRSEMEGTPMTLSFKSARAAKTGAVLAAALCASALTSMNAMAQDSASTTAPAEQPNIMFIMADDVGYMQPGIYHRGLMVGETPNIDRIGHEGAMFTDYYAQQSCTAGHK